MTPLVTDRLLLRDWREADRPAFRLLNADERVMRFFPFRRSDAEADALMDDVRGWIERDGFGFAAITLRETGACIGFCGLLRTDAVPSRPDGAVEIGWRLLPEHWGKGYATEAAAAWLELGFEKLGLAEIVSFAVHDNQASTAVMQRLGMRRDPSGDFDHPAVPDTHPHLQRHVFYTLDRNRYADMKKAG